jgi:hypothetical protein
VPVTLPSDFFKQYRPWQWIKYMILSEYLVPWSMKLGSTSSPIFVVDLWGAESPSNSILRNRKKAHGGIMAFCRPHSCRTLYGSMPYN